MEKVCIVCEDTKPLTEFSKNNSYKGKQYYSGKCKACVNDSNQQYYKEHADKIKEQTGQYYEDNKAELKAKMLEYQKEHRDEANARNRKYVDKNRNNSSFKLIKNQRERTRKALLGKIKTAHTLDLLGCTVEELKTHLQSKFTSGMHWNNYGKWHVDHILPCSRFDLSITEEQQKCFHYSNLQPLWAVDNLKKGNRISVIT